MNTSLIRYEALKNGKWEIVKDEDELLRLAENKETGFVSDVLLELYLKAYTENGKVPLKSNVIFQ